MTAQKTLEITLWRNLPSIITNTIVEESDNGRFCCELAPEQIRNIDIFACLTKLAEYHQNRWPTIRRNI